jgi:hypothetical protein
VETDIDEKKKNEHLMTGDIQVYEYYSDFVLKNPFQDINNVIHCELFDQHVTNYAKAQGIAQL